MHRSTALAVKSLVDAAVQLKTGVTECQQLLSLRNWSPSITAIENWRATGSLSGAITSPLDVASRHGYASWAVEASDEERRGPSTPPRNRNGGYPRPQSGAGGNRTQPGPNNRSSGGTRPPRQQQQQQQQQPHNNNKSNNSSVGTNNRPGNQQRGPYRSHGGGGNRTGGGNNRPQQPQRPYPQQGGGYRPHGQQQQPNRVGGGGFVNFNNNNNNNGHFVPRPMRRPAVRPIPWWERNKVQQEAAAAAVRQDAKEIKQSRLRSQPRGPREPEALVIPHDVTVVKLAHLFGVNVRDLEKVLADLGEPPRSEEDAVAPDAAELAAMELGKVSIVAVPPTGRKAKGKIAGKDVQGAAAAAALLPPRPAVVTVMGHVDHGKTTLLDALRKTSVAAREAGGITQHVGAFEVRMPGSGQSLTFLDTPGHAAFSAMRARGAAVTDLVVLVVAADDGVMPQTKEALAHAQAAGCPIVVAITKCDVPAADPEKVRRQLLAAGLLLEGSGGNVQFVEVAAPTGQGLPQLEEALLLEGEMLELAADPDAPAMATVIEARLERGQGPLVTVIVTRGTLKVGQPVVVGCEWGKVRALRSPGGDAVASGTVLPGQPAEVVGLKGLPLAGDELMAVVSEERAQRVSKARTNRSEVTRRAALARVQPPLANVGPNGEEQRIIPLVVKADVQGSAEAVRDALNNLSSKEVRVHVVHAGVGPVSFSDISLAVPSGAKVVGFNVKVAADAEAEAKAHGVEVLTRRVIYEILGDVGAWIEGLMPRELQEVVIGSAHVLATFQASMAKGREKRTVAGCRVGEGTLRSGVKIRVLRGGDVVAEGVCNSLRRHKLDVDTVGHGTECGVGVEGFDDFQPGDVLQCVDIQ